MYKNPRLDWLIFLLFIPWMFGCTASKSEATREPVIGITDLSSYRVEDKYGLILLPVADLIFDYPSGKIDYIAVGIPSSGFTLDIRTAPYQSDQVILIPGRLANLDVEKKQFELQVSAQSLMKAPRFNSSIESLPNNWKSTVEQYWMTDQ